MSLTERTIPLADGRTVDVLLGEAPSRRAFVSHHGTPSDATIWNGWESVAREHGTRLVALTRPGYAGSTRQPGRSVSSIASDVIAVLDALGLDDFVTIGWSGGGPHALACAALIPERCRAVAVLAGVAPFDAPALAWFDGMARENIAELGAAAQGEGAIREWLTLNADVLRSADAHELAPLLGDLASEVDRAALAAGFAQTLAGAIRRALAPGFDGWIDDDLAMLKPWGFGVESIVAPVTVWQGDADLMVPDAHGRWLAGNVPGAVLRLVAGHGHISLIVTFREGIARELVAAAASS
jgi:pimeloyl-ACP methyl ester carboxylesterase